jgi:hypothetical protein
MGSALRAEHDKFRLGVAIGCLVAPFIRDAQGQRSKVATAARPPCYIEVDLISVNTTSCLIVWTSCRLLQARLACVSLLRGWMATQIF